MASQLKSVVMSGETLGLVDPELDEFYRRNQMKY